MHDKQRAVALQSQIFLIFNQDTDGFFGIFNAVCIGSMVLPFFGKILVNVVFSFWEADGNALGARFFCFFCRGKGFLYSACAVGLPGRVDVEVRRVNNSARFGVNRRLRRYRSREWCQRHTKRQYDG